MFSGKNKCPNCKEKNSMEYIGKTGRYLKCNKCGYVARHEEV